MCTSGPGKRRYLQVVRLAEVAAELGAHDVAVGISVTTATVQRAISSKRNFASKETST
jgi:hypothetical protein